MCSAGDNPLDIIKTQRSHLLFLLSNAAPGKDAAYIQWYRSEFSTLIGKLGEKVLAVQLFRQHEIDVCKDEYQQIPFRYLNIIELSLDGAQQAESLIEKITAMQIKWLEKELAAWLYYPICEKVGRSANRENSMLTIAFANPLAGKEDEFREWYCTRHIRHALNVSALVSGQCFQLTNYQHSETAPSYKIIAIYEQEGSPEEMIVAFESLPEETFSFPALDLQHFSEWVYEPVTNLYLQQ